MYADIQPNADAFARALEELGEKIEQDVFEKVIHKVLFDLWQEIVKETPVDTGRAKGSWMLDVDWRDWELPEGDYAALVKEQGDLGRIIGSLPKSEKYVLFNNLEYIQALEEGHSTQAPAGFVAKALAAMAEFLGRAAKSAGYEVTA